jgi:hypothetical protein
MFFSFASTAVADRGRANIRARASNANLFIGASFQWGRAGAVNNLI